MLTTALLIAMLCITLLSLWLLFVVYCRFPVAAIYRSKVHLEDAFDSFDDPLAVVSQGYRLLRVNKAYCTLTGLSFKQLLNQRCYAMLRHRTSPCSDCRLGETIDTAMSRSVEMTTLPTLQGERSITITFFPFREKSAVAGTLNGVEHIRDISATVKLKKDLETHNRVLRKTGRELKRAQRSFDEELRLAREVQRGTLPLAPAAFPSLNIQVLYHPVEEVGGDLYDFVSFGTEKLGIFIGDAAGHGLSAAFVSMLSKMALHNHTRELRQPVELLQSLNEDLASALRQGHYLTCCWLVFNASTGRFDIARAGHPRPIVIRADGTVLELNAHGTLLGILDDPQLKPLSYDSSPGDRLFLFTDGIFMTPATTTRHNNARLTTQQLGTMLQRHSAIPLDKALHAIERELNDYTREDDYTLIALEVTGP